MIKSLTSLRGIFILFIFLHHAGVYAGGGSMAVAFFFILSGFSMTLGYKDRVLKPEFSYKQYITRRCIKFYPLHWITLIADIPYVLMGVVNWWFIPLFFVNAALLQTLVPIQKVYFSFNAVSWFLADIMFFAVLFPFVLKTIMTASKKTLGAITVVMIVCYLFVLTFPVKLWHPLLYVNPIFRFYDFVFGILLALWCNKVNDLQRVGPFKLEGWGSLLLICLLISLLVLESVFMNKKIQLIAPLYWPLIAILIIVAAVAKPNSLRIMENKVLLWLGECSFVIFLVHRLVIRYTEKLIQIDDKTLFVLFTLSLTLLSSFIVDKYILNPITQWLTKRIQPSMTAQS